MRVMRKAQLSAEQMKELAFLTYKRRVANLLPGPSNCWTRAISRYTYALRRAVVSLLRADKLPAEVPRSRWNTRQLAHSVIVQCMVNGNVELESSGTGVVSYDPFTLELRGDFALGDQGTDVVDGKVTTIPVYDLWQSRESLASQMPEAWKQLSGILFRTAERLHFDTRLEYTIEKGKVFILQIRKDRERKERIPSLKISGYRVIAQGTGVSGKIFRGIMVTDRNQIAPFRHMAKAQSIIDAMNENLPECDRLDGFIFVVNDPIPEEIMEEIFCLPVATALVSRLGGRGAHAADISKSLGKGLRGAGAPNSKICRKTRIRNVQRPVVVVGSKMIIHGQTGEIGLYGKGSKAHETDRSSPHRTTCFLKPAG